MLGIQETKGRVMSRELTDKQDKIDSFRMIGMKTDRDLTLTLRTEPLSLSSGYLSLWQLLFDLPDELELAKRSRKAFARDETAIRYDWDRVGKDAWRALDSLRSHQSR
jgi:hypothetical protein